MSTNPGNTILGRWPFGTVLRREFWHVMVIEDNGVETEMMTLGDHYPTYGNHPDFYAPGTIWTWQMKRDYWEVVDVPA